MVFLNYTNSTVSNVFPGFLTGGVIENAIDLDSPDDTDLHTQQSHVWLSNGPLEMRVEFNASYDLSTFLFWNYFTEQYDVDTVTIEYRDNDNNLLGTDTFEPETGPNPSEAESFDLTDRDGVAAVDISLDGTNGQVDFQNVGFIGTPSEGENQPPVAVDDTILSQGTSTVFNVIGNDTDPDGTVVDAQVVDGPTNGFLVDEDGGGFIYGPTDFNATSDSFTYVAIDDDGATSNVATVTITFEETNSPPVAVDDSYSTPQDTAIFVPAPGVFSNDSDPDGTIVTANLVTATSDPVALMFVDDGSFSFTPAAGFTGTETFQYEAVDDDGDVSNVATVTITVGADCITETGTAPSETFSFTGGQLEIVNFDTNSGAEATSDTLEFTFGGTDYALNTVDDFIDFAGFLESDGDGSTDAVRNEGGDLAFILSRNADGSVAEGIVLLDIIENGDDPSINDGLTEAALDAVGTDMFNMFADESDAFCSFAAAEPLIA